MEQSKIDNFPMRGRIWIEPAARLLESHWLSTVGVSDPRFEWFTRVFRQFAGGRITTLEHLVDMLTVSDDVIESLGASYVTELLSRLDEYGSFVLEMLLEEELFSVLASVTEAQFVPILADSFGWSGRHNGNPLCESQAIQQYEDTSELGWAAGVAKDAIREARFWTPALNRALEHIAKYELFDAEAIGSQLHAAGITQLDSFDGTALRLACDVLGKPVPPLLLGTGSSRIPADDKISTSAWDQAQPSREFSLGGTSDPGGKLPSNTLPRTQEVKPMAALGRLAAWAALQHGASTLGELVNVVKSSESLPNEIAAAWTAFIEADTTATGTDFLPLYDPIVSFRSIQGDFLPEVGSKVRQSPSEGARRWKILVQRVIPVGKPATLQELAQELGVTRERVRQLEVKVREQLQQCISDPSARALVLSAAQLRQRMGNVCPREDVNRHMVLRFDLNPDMIHQKATIERLILWVAGPYHEVTPGWLVNAHVPKLPERTLAVLQDATQGGPISKDKAISIVRGLGVLPEYAERWIQQIGHFKVSDERLVRWSGPFADKAEQILMLAGEPLTREELHERVGEDVSRGPVQLLYTDQRFIRTSRIHIGLRAWGLEEYSTIEEEIAQEIDRQGGQASADHLVATLTSNFHVAESSVRMYLTNSPNFSRTTGGQYVNKSRWFKPRDNRPLGLSRGCFKIDDHWALKIPVSKSILRGSGSGISTPFASHLGAKVPGSRVQLASPAGSIAIVSGPTGTTISSLRRVTNSLGAKEGDLLFIRFIGDGKLDFFSVPKATVDRENGSTRLAYEVGLGRDDVRATLSSIAHAIGLSGSESVDQIRHRFMLRREPELAELLPGDLDIEENRHENRAGDDALSELLRLI